MYSLCCVVKKMSVSVALVSALLLLSVTQAEKLPAPLEENSWKIPLILNTSDQAPEKEIIYIGVPFPKGLLAPDAPVTVVNQEGQPVPTTSRVMAFWPETNSVRWLGVDFQGSATENYFVTSGETPEILPRLQIEKQEGAYHINTGSARFVIPESGPLVREAGVIENDIFRPLLQNSKAGDLYLIDQTGRTALASQDSSDGQLILESDSALKAVFRREGWYVSTDGEKLARHITRLYFYAGQARCRIEHSLILTESTETLWFQEYGLRFHYEDSGRPTVVTLPKNDRPDSELQEISFSGETREVFLFQKKAFWLSRTDEARDCYFEIGKTAQKQSPEILHTGTLAGNWIRTHTDVGSIQITIPNLWQTFPKELRATPDALEVLLWSSRGGEELDFRMDTIRKRLPEEWVNDKVNRDEERELLLKAEKNAQGIARSHEIWLDFAPSKEAIQQHASFSATEKTIATVDPVWLRHSEAMGRIHPYDPERFPQEEDFMENFFDQHMEIYQQWGEFGFFDYGSGPHVWFFRSKEGPLAGRWIPTMQRYPLDYGFHAHLWRMFVRSGQKKYFDVANRMTRFRLDFGMVHWAAPRKIKGTYHATTSGPVPWGNTSSFHSQSGTDLRSLAYLYYLTDYRPAHEMLEAYAEAVKTLWNSKSRAPLRGTRPFASLKNLATVYQETGADPELKKIVEEQTEWLADLNAPQGVAEERELTRLHKYGIKSGAMQRVAEVLDNEIAAKSIIKGATTMASAPSGQFPFTYYNSSGEQMSEAYHRTGNPLFVRALARDMALAISYYRKETGRGWKPLYPTLGPVSALNVYPLGGMAFAMDALVEYEKRKGKEVELTPFARQAGQGRNVLAAFKKPIDTAIQIDLRSPQPLAPRILTQNGEVVSNIQKEVFTDQLETRTSIPTRYLLTLPSDAREGTYLIDPGVNGAPWEVTWTNASELVLVAPGGLIAGPGGRAWGNRIMPATPDHSTWLFFQVPKETTSFQVLSSGSLHLRQPDGKTIFLGDRLTEPKTISVPEDMAGKLWAFRAAAPRFVQFIGIPTFFAYGQEERFFLPEIPETVLSSSGLNFPEAHSSLTIDSAYGSDETALSDISGIMLNEERYLTIPHADTLLSRNQGTLEFWIRPATSSVMHFDNSRAIRTILQTGTWEALLHRHGEMSLTVTAEPDQESEVRSSFETNAGMVLENDRWTHIAIQWAGGGENFQWKIFINGAIFGATEVLDEVDETDENTSSLPVATNPFLPAPANAELTLGANAKGQQPLNAFIAGLRFSSIDRYKENFQPEVSQTTHEDAHVLGIFLFDHSLNGTISGHGTVSATLQERKP